MTITNKNLKIKTLVHCIVHEAGTTSNIDKHNTKMIIEMSRLKGEIHLWCTNKINNSNKLPVKNNDDNNKNKKKNRTE